ncbi:MAG: hypothetical protein HY703_07835 [Gemmatimonadetes bacterium]|nr:hypothetical protein [Gemmatimonadota bacterium]
MRQGLFAILGLVALALLTIVGALVSEWRQKGWKSALLTLGVMAATLLAFTGFVRLVIAR